MHSGEDQCSRGRHGADPGGRFCCSRGEMAVLRSQLKIKAVLSAGFGAQCPRLLPESKVSIRRWDRSHCMFLWCSPLPAPPTQSSSSGPGGWHGCSTSAAPDMIGAFWKKGQTMRIKKKGWEPWFKISLVLAFLSLAFPYLTVHPSAARYCLTH